jgi:hypothetical protein
MHLYEMSNFGNSISGVMDSVIASSVVDRGFEHCSGQAKTRKLVFVASPRRIKGKEAIRVKSKDWLSRN